MGLVRELGLEGVEASLEGWSKEDRTKGGCCRSVQPSRIVEGEVVGSG